MIIFVFTLAYYISYINAHRTIFCLKENSLFQALQNFVFSLKVGFAFKVVFIKTDSSTLVSFFYAVESPAVHFFPESANFRITCFPLNQHIFCHLSSFWVSCFRLVFFTFEIFVELNVALAYKVIALHSKAFRSVAICLMKKFICEHRFTDMNTTIIDEVYLINISTSSL